MENTRCELCNCVLEEVLALDYTQLYRYGNICKKCLTKLLESDEYFSLAKRNRELNNFSYWYPKIVNCGIKTPKSFIFKVPENVQTIFMSDYEEGQYEVVNEWISKEILPVLKEKRMYLLFAKNGTYSDKFNATNCMTTPQELTNAIITINYNALIVGAGGFDEVIIRERIMHNMQLTPCIYKVLPLRSEFRVFYDFTKKKVIFIENYWKYDYVFPNLYDATDKIVFEHEKERLEKDFESRKYEVENLVANAMQGVEGLDGPWSVDIMYENGTYYLIDMALAEMSAYWENRPSNKVVLERINFVAERRKKEHNRENRTTGNHIVTLEINEINRLEGNNLD